MGMKIRWFNTFIVAVLIVLLLQQKSYIVSDKPSTSVKITLSGYKKLYFRLILSNLELKILPAVFGILFYCEQGPN